MQERQVFDVRHYPAGREIFRQGDEGSAMYLVVEGKVEIWQGKSGQKLVLGYIGRGGIFGEMALIDGSPRMASATVAEDSHIRVFPLGVFKEKVSKVDAFVRALLRVLVNNVRDSNREIQQLHGQIATLSAKLDAMEAETLKLRESKTR
jgi:CRP/FNR family transcriptional regulator, cyclic AMP receptor protein